MLPQSQTEGILTTRLGELGGRVHRPYRATVGTPTQENATVTITGPDGAQHSTHAPCVLGGDGMHSTVRQAADIGFAGGRYPQSFVLADVEMDWPLPPVEADISRAPTAIGRTNPTGRGHRQPAAQGSGCRRRPNEVLPHQADSPILSSETPR